MKHNVKVNLSPSNQIRLRVTFSGHRVDISTGLSYDPDKWVDGKAKPNTKNQNRQSATEVNNSIARMVQVVDDYFVRCDLQGISPSVDALKKTCSTTSSKAKSLTFAQVFSEFVIAENAKRKFSDSRLKSLAWFRKVIESQYSNLLIRDITTDWVVSAKNKMAENYLDSSLSLMQINFNMFLKYTNKQNLTDVAIRETNIKIKKIKEDAQVYLEDDELQRVRDVELTDPTLDYYRDVFVFACYSGLRISDIRRLKKSDVANGTITKDTLKTGKVIHIELNKFTQHLYKKYTELFPDSKKLFAMPISAKNNMHLKEIAKLAGVDKMVTIVKYQSGQKIEITKPKYEHISSHAARRTFVVQCLELGIPPLVIIKWTGHANLTQLSPYIAVVDKLKKQEMEKFNK